MTEILLAKLLPPRPGKGMIDRSRLIHLLNGIEERKLTLLTAPAGYGKTVLMLQLADAAKRALVWYQLDAYDNDPAVFLKYLITGIRGQLPDFGLQAQQLIEEGGVENRLRLMVTAIVNGLIQQADRPLLLILDDYQTISEPLLHRFVLDFLEHLPACVHVMIASRALLPINLSRFKTSGEVLCIGIEELRFTNDEINNFLNEKTPHLSPQIQEFLKQKVNGWPAAVKLLADSISNTDISLQINSSTVEIYNYLANEVLEQQPEQIKEFLLKTAVLEVITVGDCNLLLKRDDSELIMDRLEKQNLFLLPLVELRHAYRYHQLFREFLLERLGPERKTWQREAGMIAQNRGDLASAIEYYLMANALDDFLAILPEAGKRAIRQGRWQTLERWLDFLPREQIVGNSWPVFFQAQVEAYRGRMEEASTWLRQAIALFSTRQDLSGLAESQLLQARILRFKGFYQQSLELLAKVLPSLRIADHKLRFDFTLEQSLSLVMTGRFQESEVLLKKSLMEAERDKDVYIVAYLLELLGLAYYLQGEYSKALQIYQRKITVAPEQNLPDYYTHNYTAAIYQEWGELDRAYEYARQNLAYKENLGLTETLPPAYFQMADIYLNRRDLPKAEEYFRKAVDLLEKTSGERFYLTLNKAYLARTLSEQGRFAEAEAIMEETLAEAKEAAGLGLAIAQELGAPILWRYGRRQEAKTMMLSATATLEQMGFSRPLGHAYAALTMFYAAEGDQAAAANYAAKTLAISARNNYYQSFLVADDIFRPILHFGLEHGIEIGFVQKVLARVGKPALSLLGELVHHPVAAVRSRAIVPLSEIGGESAVSILKTFREDPDPTVRQLAVENLQKIDITAGLQVKSRLNVLEIKTLGPLRLFTGETEIAPINWRTSKTRDLLAFLLHHGKPASKEVILEALWPSYPFEKAQGLFHTNLYYLRQTLEKIGYPDLVVYQNKRCELAAKLFATDRTRFQDLITAGFNDETAPEKACVFLERAINLYMDDYLYELDYVWLLPDREYLKNLYFEAGLRLARYYLERKDYHRAISHLQLLAGLDSWSEKIHQLLMTAYAGLGNRSAVREQYQTLTLILKNELGLEPSPETREIYQRLYQTG